MRWIIERSIFVIAMLCVLVSTGDASVATDGEMEQVCVSWLALNVALNGDWAGSVNPQICDIQRIELNNQYLGLCFSIDPEGYVVVPALKEMPPVMACSEENGLDLRVEGGSPLLIRQLLSSRISQYVSQYGDVRISEPEGNDSRIFDPVHFNQWSRFLRPDFAETIQASSSGNSQPISQVGPLLSSRWHQRAPYNYYCPGGDGGQCIVGCVATAASQILNLHRIPGSGSGSHSYIWDGDDSCGGQYSGGTLSATFSDGYDWGSMPDHCTTGSSTAAQQAVAELCAEVGVALEMDYGHCGSAANTFAVANVLPAYFGYKNTASVQRRSNYTSQGWLDMLKADLNRGLPTMYRFDMTEGGHAVVCDGWRDTGGINQYHINYGWQNSSYNDWFTVDYITGSVDWTREAAVVGLEPTGSAPSNMTVDVMMPSTFYQAGDPCYCSTIVSNGGSSTVSNLPLFVLLELYGYYYCAPSFSAFDYYIASYAPGNTTIPVLPTFAWPGGSGAMNGVNWYAALTNSQGTQLASNVDMFTFGWNGGGGTSWTTIKSETFEGNWPNSWQLYVDNGYADCYWDDVSCFQNSGNWAGWCAGGGSQTNGDCTTYAHNMSTLMRYGPFSLAGASDAEVQFAYWNQVESCAEYCDYFGCYASVNGQNYYGFNIKEPSGDWQQATFDLTDVYQLGNLCGQSQVYVAFYFFSDGSVTNYGTYLDDIIIRKK